MKNPLYAVQPHKASSYEERAAEQANERYTPGGGCVTETTNEGALPCECERDSTTITPVVDAFAFASQPAPSQVEVPWEGTSSKLKR